MTGNSTPGEKLRAIFLAALMVGSVFALGVSLSGTAAAAANNTNVATAGNSVVGDDITVTVDVGTDGDTATFENIVDGEVKETVTVTDGGSADEDGTEDGSIKVTLTAGKTAGGSSEVQVTNEDSGDTDSATYTTDSYLVEVSPDEVTQGDTETITGTIFEYPGDRQDDAELDYSLVYEEDASDTSEGSNDIVLAESDTNSGVFQVERTFNEVDDSGTEEHLNDYPSDDFDTSPGPGESAYRVFVDDATDNDGPTAADDYNDETPSIENNDGVAVVDTRLDVTASPDKDPIQYGDSANVSGSVANVDGGLSSYAVKLETPTGVTAKTADTASNGAFTYTAVFNDAGEWTFGTDEGGFIEYESFTVAPQSATVSIDAAGENLGFFEEDYTVQVNDNNGDGLPAQEESTTSEGYVNVTGPFDGTVEDGDVTTGNYLKSEEDDEGNTLYFHAETTDTGALEFTATPAGSSVDATLENSDESDVYGGLENTEDAGDTPENPDYVGSDSAGVDNASPVNIIGEAVEDPQDTQVTSTGDDASDGGADAPYTDILTDSGPEVVEVLPLADDEAPVTDDVNDQRIVDGIRTGYDGNQDLDKMTAYRVSFDLRNINNNAIKPGSESGDFDYMIVEGAGIDATIYNSDSNDGTVAVDTQNGNLLDATYDRNENGRYEFLIRPTSTESADEEITHEIQVVDEDPVFLNLSAAGLDIDEFQVDGETKDAVRGSSTLNVSAIVEAPYDDDAPVNNGRVRLTQDGATLDADIDARTANVNNGNYTFENIDIGPRGIDNGDDGIADDISELVFTAYQYNDANGDQALSQSEVDRAAVESLPLAIDDSLQVEYLPDQTSTYSGVKEDDYGGTFTLTKGVEYEQIAFELTDANGDPVDLTAGIDGAEVSLNTLADETTNDGEQFVELVGAVQDDGSSHSVHFDEDASDPANGVYVIDDIETSSYVASENDAEPEADDVFAFDEASDRDIDTFQLKITTPDVSFETNEDTGYFNVDEPAVDTEIAAVSTDDRASFTDVDNVSEMTVGVDRWYRVNGTWTDALGTPIDGSEFGLSQIVYSDSVGGAEYQVLSNLDNDVAGESDNIVDLGNESGAFQIDIKPTDANDTGVFEPQIQTYAHNFDPGFEGSWAGADGFPDVTSAGTPTGQLPLVEVYDENGADLPVNPSDASDNEVLAQDVTNNLRVEVFPADANDTSLPNDLRYGIVGPYAESDVEGTTTLSEDVVTDGYDEGQLVFLSVSPTSTGDGLLDLRTDDDETESVDTDDPITVDTTGDRIKFDVLQSNLQVNIGLSDQSVVAGDNVNVTLTRASTGATLPEDVAVSLINPDGTEVDAVTTDDDGQAVIQISEDATSGTWSVQTRPAGYAPTSTDLSVLTPASVDVTEFSVSNDTLKVGDELTVEATVENTGDAAGTQEVTLYADGEAVENTTVNVAGNSAETVTFTTSFDDADTYNVSVNDLGATEVTVEALKSNFEVSDLSAPANVTQGDNVTVTATVTNTGGQKATQAVEFQFAGETAASQNVTLNASEDTTAEFTVPVDAEPGTYTHGVFTANDSQTAQITVEPKPATFEVTAFDVPDEAVQGDTVDVTATIENTGGEAAEKPISLVIDGEEEAVTSETLLADSSTDVTFSLDTTDLSVADHTVAVKTPDDEAQQNITVQQPATFEVSDLDAPANVTQGDNVTVTATVENTGDVEATQTVEFQFAGDTVAEENVTLAGGASQTVEFTVSTSGIEAGNYTHGVFTADDNATATIEIETVVTIGDNDPAADLDGDGLFEDVNGDGNFNVVDVSVLFENRNSDAVQNNQDLFNFDGQGSFTVVDVSALFDEATS